MMASVPVIPAEIRNTFLRMARDSARILVRSEGAFFGRSARYARTDRYRDLIRREVARDWAIVAGCSLEGDLEELARLGLADIGAEIRDDTDRRIAEARESRCLADRLDPLTLGQIGTARDEEAARSGRN